MIYVIDASVALKWLLTDEVHPNAELVLEEVINAPMKFAVPELFAFEVYAVLQRLHPDGAKAFSEGIIPILQSGILRHPMTGQLAKIANHFVKMGLTGYDACYAALAQDLSGAWLTYDKKAHHSIRDKNLSCLLTDQMPAEW